MHEAPLARSLFTVGLASYGVWFGEERQEINGNSKERILHFLYFDTFSLIGGFQSFIPEDRQDNSFDKRRQLIKNKT